MFFLLLAATAEPLVVRFPATNQLLDPNDYPAWALRASKSAAAAFRLVLDAKGKPLGCTMTAQVGDPKLAAEACPIHMKKRFPPARLADGTPVAASFSTSYIMTIPDSPQGEYVRRTRLSLVPDIALPGPAKATDAAGPDQALLIVFDTKSTIPNCQLSGGAADPATLARACEAGLKMADDLRVKAGLTAQATAISFRVRVNGATAAR